MPVERTPKKILPSKRASRLSTACQNTSLSLLRTFALSFCLLADVIVVFMFYYLRKHSKASSRIDSIRILLSNFAAVLVCSRLVERSHAAYKKRRTSHPESHRRSWWIVHTQPTKQRRPDPVLNPTNCSWWIVHTQPKFPVRQPGYEQSTNCVGGMCARKARWSEG